LADVKPASDEDLELKGKWASLLPSIPEGQNYLFHTPEGDGLPLFGWRTRYWSFLLKLAKNRPSWTIPAQPGPSIGPFHWENRRLSMRELCRLQTFPDEVQIEGGRTAIQRQLGNAVPSLLAEILAREIRVQLLGLPPLKGAPKLLPAKRTEVPRRFPVRAVPAEFDKYKGAHKPHPGVGRGPGATAQLKAAV
jgi:DNA (cytosine-5)-methyltransferase 1